MCGTTTLYDASDLYLYFIYYFIYFSVHPSAYLKEHTQGSRLIRVAICNDFGDSAGTSVQPAEPPHLFFSLYCIKHLGDGGTAQII